MRTIYKYPLTIEDYQVVKMVAGGRILTAQTQGDTLCLWAEVSTDNVPAYQAVGIRIYGTGNPMPDDPGKYLSTVQLYDGKLVFHVYVA